MDIYVNRTGKMVQTGHSLLKLIQNSSLSTVDLLVRESLQNSLDAAIHGGKKVTANFITGKCERVKVDAIFTGITKALGECIEGEKTDFIAISDKGTTGLTGPLLEADYEEDADKGNLRKLIYEICQAQSVADKGGSWGLGKTVYFRVGVGIVIYYTRIAVSGGYEERLAAALIEDEKKKDSLLRKAGLKNGKQYSGIAWWGKNVQDDTCPITEKEEITQILSVFNLTPYDKDETGTMLIIPYIDAKKLCQNANVLNYPPFDNMNLDGFIDMAVQRWYLPRLYNKKYPNGAYLEYLSNGKKKRPAEREPFFQKMQELYNDALDNGEKINLRSEFANTGSGCAGYMSWVTINQNELGNPTSPLALIHVDSNAENSDENPPIIAYCRKAGMVINYETSSQWTAGIRKTGKGEYNIAFFVLNSDNMLKADPNMTLDHYIRTAEPADHMTWEDQSINGKMCRIIDKIKKNVAKKLAKAVAPVEVDTNLHRERKLQKLMGSLFLPPKGFGRLGGKRGDTPTGGGAGGQNKQKPGMHDLTIDYINDTELVLDWTIKLKKNEDKIVQEISAVTGSNVIYANTWEDNIKGLGTSFPFDLKSFSAQVEDMVLPVERVSSKQGVVYAFIIDTADLKSRKRKKPEIKCHAVIKCSDRTFTCNLGLREDVK